MDIVLATRNNDKVKEISRILAPIDIALVGLDSFGDVPEVVEDGATLVDNALKKARGVRDATGMCALADDTGLEVDALDGAPGVYSARYAGDDVTYADNNTKLLSELSDVADGERGARFRCVMALALTSSVVAKVRRRLEDDKFIEVASSGDDILIAEGMLPGRIAKDARGTSGFGYDPVFEVPESGTTLAEMGSAQKNKISHRYRALVELRELMLRCGLASERSNV